jgi:hypothetical protein
MRSARRAHRDDDAAFAVVADADDDRLADRETGRAGLLEVVGTCRGWTVVDYDGLK